MAPGVGLFDNSGNPLASQWGDLVPSAAFPIGECAVDGFGHVYVGGGPSAGSYPGGSATIRKFDLSGHLLRSYTVDASAGAYSRDARNLDLGPDQCTIYYNLDGGAQIKRFNVCTNTQGPAFAASLAADQLRVRPNGQLISADDTGWSLLDPSGQFLSRVGGTSVFGTSGVRDVALDPDGSSVWIAGGGQPDFGLPGVPFENVARFDISSGRLLARWAALDSGNYGPSLAVYSPPLIGNANINSNLDSNPPGTAEALPTRVSYSGQITSLDLYLDSASTASQAAIGIYSDNNGHPGTLLDHATITNAAGGSWNHVQVPSISITNGQHVWIAILAPSGVGTIRFRDAAHSAAGSETSAQHKLTALPPTWATGETWPTGNLSAFGN